MLIVSLQKRSHPMLIVAQELKQALIKAGRNSDLKPSCVENVNEFKLKLGLPKSLEDLYQEKWKQLQKEQKKYIYVKNWKEKTTILKVLLDY